MKKIILILSVALSHFSVQAQKDSSGLFSTLDKNNPETGLYYKIPLGPLEEDSSGSRILLGKNIVKALEALEPFWQWKIAVEVHTDCRGTEGSNQKSSQRMADSIRQFIGTLGYDITRFDAYGMGESDPLIKTCSCSDFGYYHQCSEEENGQNRRVIFWLDRELTRYESHARAIDWSNPMVGQGIDLEFSQAQLYSRQLYREDPGLDSMKKIMELLWECEFELQVYDLRNLPKTSDEFLKQQISPEEQYKRAAQIKAILPYPDQLKRITVVKGEKSFYPLEGNFMRLTITKVHNPLTFTRSINLKDIRPGQWQEFHFSHTGDINKLEFAHINELEAIKSIVEATPEWKFTLEKNTDCTLDEDSNLCSSQKYADELKTFLGILNTDTSRITAVGNGETKKLMRKCGCALEDNLEICTADEHERNKVVVLRVDKKKSETGKPALPFILNEPAAGSEMIFSYTNRFYGEDVTPNFDERSVEQLVATVQTLENCKFEIDIVQIGDDSLHKEQQATNSGLFKKTNYQAEELSPGEQLNFLYDYDAEKSFMQRVKEVKIKRLNEATKSYPFNCLVLRIVEVNDYKPDYTPVNYSNPQVGQAIELTGLDEKYCVDTISRIMTGLPGCVLQLQYQTLSNDEDKIAWCNAKTDTLFKILADSGVDLNYLQKGSNIYKPESCNKCGCSGTEISMSCVKPDTRSNKERLMLYITAVKKD